MSFELKNIISELTTNLINVVKRNIPILKTEVIDSDYHITEGFKGNLDLLNNSNSSVKVFIDKLTKPIHFTQHMDKAQTMDVSDQPFVLVPGKVMMSVSVSSRGTLLSEKSGFSEVGFTEAEIQEKYDAGGN